MVTTKDMSALAEEIVGSYTDRIARIAELKETVKMDLRDLRRHLEQFRDSRVTMSTELRADLARSADDRKREVGDMLKGFGAELKELGRAHAAMSKELKADLAKSVGDLKDGVGALLKGFNAQLKEIRSELAGARDEWQKLTATMQAKRGGVAIRVKEIARITPETADLRNRVFEYLANHPDGTKMTELEREFGLARIQTAKVLRSLVDENKVEKRDLLYFAV